MAVNSVDAPFLDVISIFFIHRTNTKYQVNVLSLSAMKGSSQKCVNESKKCVNVFLGLLQCAATIW